MPMPKCPMRASLPAGYASPLHKLCRYVWASCVTLNGQQNVFKVSSQDLPAGARVFIFPALSRICAPWYIHVAAYGQTSACKFPAICCFGWDAVLPWGAWRVISTRHEGPLSTE